MKISKEHSVGKRGGFSLVELLTVVILLGVVAAVVLPNAGYSDGEKALMAARKVATDIEYAQSEAVNQQSSITVSFSPSGETYSLASGSTALTDPTDGNSFDVNLPGDLHATGVDINSADFGSGESVVVFNALGEPVMTNGSPISSNAKVVIRCGDSAYTVSIAPVTGRVVVAPGS